MIIMTTCGELLDDYKRQMQIIVHLDKQLKKLRDFREKRESKRRLPHDEFKDWIFEQAREL